MRQNAKFFIFPSEISSLVIIQHLPSCAVVLDFFTLANTINVGSCKYVSLLSRHWSERVCSSNSHSRKRRKPAAPLLIKDTLMCTFRTEYKSDPQIKRPQSSKLKHVHYIYSRRKQSQHHFHLFSSSAFIL